MNSVTITQQKVKYSDIKNHINFEHIIIAFMFGIAVFTYSTDFIDVYGASKYCFTQFFFFVTVCILCIKFALGKEMIINVFVVSVIIAIICGIEAIYTILQYFFRIRFGNLYYVSGHFDNPAGLISCLCVGLPFVLYAREKIKLYKYAVNMIIAIIFIAIVLSSSRTGIIIALLLIFKSLLERYGMKKYIWTIISIVAICLVIIGYQIKTESADGRILIWKSSLYMMGDAPFIGYGLGGFKKLYMDYQASFLSSINNEKYNLLADNTLYPFNEFINLYVCFGVAGYLLFFIVIAIIFCGYKRSKSVDKKVAISSFMMLAFISFFSYPFKYPFTYLICIFNLYILIKDLFNDKMISICRVVAVFFAIGCIPIACSAYEKIEGEYRWKQAYIDKNLELYKSLLPILGDNPLFLYNYSAELFEKYRIDESLEIAQLCKHELSSYDLELLLGDIYFFKHEYKLAEMHYIKASRMCPCRFIPLNQLFDLYKMINDEKSALAIAEKVVNKPIKVKSRTVTQIKYKMLHAMENKPNYKVYNQN